MRARIGRWLRRLADRIDDRGAPRAIGHSFTFEDRVGIRFRYDGKGCPLWYLSEGDYRRAHLEADTDHAIIDFKGARVHIPGTGEWPAEEWG